jgi:hypothetical protein
MFLHLLHESHYRPFRCLFLLPTSASFIPHIAMHLLNTTTLRLSHFFNSVPNYAILSHTWTNEEVTFENIHTTDAVSKVGYPKLFGACTQARNDGFEWLWVDTCCVDHKSSAEISEAVNSSYKYFWLAEKCYVYLSDVPARTFVEAAWFVRSWTLQELLAPSVIEFYDQEWVLLGTKSSLVKDISETTSIETKFLLNRTTLRNASIGQIFAWAAKRTSTRPEDVAYSLLGLIGLSMPLFYGEGKQRAFRRLQLKIIKESTDHTIFAWEAPSSRKSEACALQLDDYTSILAPSPVYFALHTAQTFVHRMPSLPHLENSYVVTNNGIRISLPCYRSESYPREKLGLLNCCTSPTRIAAIRLRKTKHLGNEYVRVPGSRMVYVTPSQERSAEVVDMFLYAGLEQGKVLGSGAGVTSVLRVE